MLRAEILRALPDGDVGIEAVAARLAIGERTLRRRLADTDAVFRDLVDEVRRGVALDRLRDPGLSIQEVAFLVGFSEPRAFQRAFRRWMGETPTRYRSRHAAPARG